MATYSIEVPTIVETQITGCLGTAIATYRGHEWRVRLDAPQLARDCATRDGEPTSHYSVPLSVWRFAMGWYTQLAQDAALRAREAQS